MVVGGVNSDRCGGIGDGPRDEVEEIDVVRIS